MSPKEAKQVMRRWADHLAKTDDFEKSLHIYISLQEYTETLKLLTVNGFYDLAALFIEACEEKRVRELCKDFFHIYYILNFNN